MMSKKNKCFTKLIALVILASCSTTSKNLNLNSIDFIEEETPKEFLEIYDYQSYFNDDLKTIQAAIDSQMLSQAELNDAKILKRNYQKILKRQNYSLGLKLNHKYSKELIELIYRLNLPISIFWDEEKVLECHPDRVVARGMPEEAIKLAQTKLAQINNAYEQIVESM